MEEQKEQKWFQKPNGVTILLVLLLPVGIYLMWKNNIWSKRTRFIITGITSLVVILNISTGNIKSTSSSSSNSSSKSESYRPNVGCDWCGRSFKKGSGYNTAMRMINTPDADFSKYCSRKCASDFLRKN